jgi:hypothetical protein
LSELIGHVSALPLQPFQFSAFEGTRRVASFGFRYDYTLQLLQPADPIPGWLLPLIEKVEAYGSRRRKLRRFSAPNVMWASESADTATSRIFRPDLRPFAWNTLQVLLLACGW